MREGDPTHVHTPTITERLTGQWAVTQGWGARPLIFFGPVQTGLLRELAKSLTRAMQLGLVSPGGSDQAQWYHPASLSSESGESLRPVGCCSAKGGDAEPVRATP